MSLDSDVALLGTGLAPLVVANQLMSQGYRVLLLNPDPDFFLENSELSLDPLWPLERETMTPERLKLNLPEKALEILRPGFPGPVELWTDRLQGGAGQKGGFHDLRAPPCAREGTALDYWPRSQP